ncbi:prepilin peptidase [Cryobacterium psychrophilum]|uniref:Prepilin peptidase n=1 Tax=Cryobacterium psychrophilum TaxID=41988 RepID=A0A4Y8KU93_9MICO|nr:A24 family peptidase [Cryobacterium psychrophilum]TDW30406.1 leader peptidase (prepilin peptidase)/N-methyltransferase [Cryobacterium psychrophilum]TFD79090.1 prepilin peptidase [Cryobacterium psychrophilum]
MAPWVAIVAGLFGSALGVPLVRIAERMLRIRRRFSPPVLVVAVAATGVLIALVVWVFGAGWELPAYLYLSFIAVVLSVVDLAEKRLPNALVYPSLLVLPVLLTLAAAATGSWPALLGACIGGASLFVFYFVLALISPAGIGMGDVKLAAVIGLALGYLGWTPLLVGSLGGFLVGSLVALVALAARRVTLRGSIPFGPSMLAGAFLGVLLA